MKKLIALILTVAMVASMGIMAFAEKGGFVYSPSVNPAPVIEDQKHADDSCPGELVVTPYVERDTLDEDKVKTIEDAYEEIVNLQEGDDLYALLEELSGKLGIPADMLLVSDLFELSYTNCGEHAEHTPYSVQLSSDTFKNFAGLVHYENGTWVSVEDVTIDENGVISFSYDGYGPFAVVVDTTETGSPITGDNGILIFCIVMMVISLAGFVTVFIAAKKKKTAQGR